MVRRFIIVAGALIAPALSSFSCRGADAVSLALTPIVRRAEEGEGNERPVTGTLVRDLARQALLVAARDELGLRTLDAALREQADDAAALELELTADARINEQCTVRIIVIVEAKELAEFTWVTS